MTTALIFLNIAVLAALVLLLVRLWPTAAASKRPAAEPRPAFVADALPFPVALVDRQLNVLDGQAAADGADARAILDSLPDDAVHCLRVAVANALDTRREDTARFLLNDHWYVAQIIPLPTGAAAALWLRDVTEEKSAAQRAEGLARRNEAILRSAMDGFFVVGEDHRFIEVNDAFCRMLGYSAAELKELTTSDLETRDSIPGRPPSNMRTGLHHVATAHRHKNGQLVQLETSMIIIRDGGKRLLVGFARDVTDRIRTEQRLVSANERFASLVARMPLGYVAVKPDWTIQEWNASAEAVLGHAPDAACGRDLRMLVLTSEQAAAAEEVSRRVASGEPGGFVQLKNTRADGRQIDCEWFYTVLRGSLGDADSIAIMVRDVSERERMQEELRRAQKLESLGILAGGVAHDFNNFLVTILCNASLLAEHLPDGRGTHYVQKILNASRRASDLTRQMLTYAGGARLEVQPTDLNELIEELIELMRAAVARNVRITTDLTPALPRIDGDSSQLQQVLMNLLLNAAEAIGDRPGEVTLRTRTESYTAAGLAADFAGFDCRAGDYVILEVRDNGCGMTPETRARIFDPFFTTKFTGRGLGLAMILGIVRAHHGCVCVNSAVGRGTTFKIALPAAKGAIRSRPPAPRPAALRRGATILVIDDDADIRDVVTDLLEARGVRVLTAVDGEHGLTTFAEAADSIDLVLLDLTMPGMSGQEVFARLRAIRADVPVIVSSGYSEQDASLRFPLEQIAGFVQKPYTAGALVEKMGSVLG